MTTPWKDGFYMAKNDTDKKIHVVKGNDVTVRDMTEFDYPELSISDKSKGTWTFGDFGQPSEKLENACQSKLCNVQFDYIRLEIVYMLCQRIRSVIVSHSHNR